MLTHPVDLGKGGALETGFGFAAAHAPGQDVVCVDSDGRHGTADVLRVAARVRIGAGLVLGVRGFTGDVPARSRFGNAVTRRLFRLATGCDVVDTQTGLRGYPAALLPWLVSIPGDRFEYELAVLLRAARTGQPIEQVTIATIYLAGNASSHFRPLADSARVYAPLLPFLLSSFAASLVDTLTVLVLAALTGALLPVVVGARLLSGSVNSAVNRRFVFTAARPRRLRAAAARYAGLAVLLMAAGYAVLATLTGLGLALLPAKPATDVLLLAVSYLVQRRSVFPARRAAAVPGTLDRPAALRATR